MLPSDEKAALSSYQMSDPSSPLVLPGAHQPSFLISPHPKLEHGKVFHLQGQLQSIRLRILPLTRVRILALNPRQNTIHTSLNLHQRMDQIPRQYCNHRCSPLLCYQNVLVSFIVGYSPALFSPNLDFWCLREHIHRNIGNGACGTSIFLLYTEEIEQELTGGQQFYYMEAPWSIGPPVLLEGRSPHPLLCRDFGFQGDCINNFLSLGAQFRS